MRFIGFCILGVAALLQPAPPAGAQTRAKVLFPSTRTYPVLSPNGLQLMFAMPDGRRKLKIHRLTLATGQVVQLTSGEQEDSAGTFSPDGKSIAFQREGADGSRDIWLMSSDGSDARPVTNTPGISEQHPGFTADGKSILFDANIDADRSKPEAEQNFEIYMVAVTGGQVRRLTDRPGWDMYPSASPDGRMFAWHGATDRPSTPPDFDIFVRSLAAGPIRAIAPSASYESNPDWHPSGKLIVFASDREAKASRRTELFVADLDGLDLRRLTNGGGTDVAYARPRFSRDGKSIVANRNAVGMVDVIQIDFAEGK